ncbi:MAG: M50 family metallopeptidase [Desulfotomaculaceae bacterium]
MRLGRFWGIEYSLNPFFLALLGLFFVAGVLDRGLIAFGVVLVHETSHALVAKRLGVPVEEVELLPFGGVARTGVELSVHPVREIYVAAAGPASNLALFSLGVALKNYGIWHEGLGPFFLQCNLLVAVFNLLPGLPLDGGHIYRALRAQRDGIAKAAYKAAGLGQLIALVVMFAGAAGIWAGYCGLDIPVTALFLFYAATRERQESPHLFLRMLRFKNEELNREGVLPVKQLAAVENIPLGMLVRPFVPRRYHLVTVLDSRHRYLGTVTETAVIDALLQSGASTRVGDLLDG